MTFRPKTWTNLGLIAAAGLAASACTYDGYEPYPYGHGRHDGGYHGDRGERGERGDRGDRGDRGERGERGDRGDRGGRGGRRGG